MPEIVQLEPRDHEEAVDFLNLIFGAFAPHDFERMLPHCYTPSRMDCNHAIREGGRIQALVGLFPRAWAAGEHRLKVGGIGGVSTHPRARGRGHMRALMAHCLQRMAREDYDLSWLQGRRHRYAHHGYELCGSRILLRFDQDSVAALEDLPLRLERVSAEHTDWLDAIAALHDAQPVRHLRPRQDLYGYLVAWKCQPFVALDEGGAVLGYLVVDPDNALPELVAREERLLPALLRAWISHSGRATELSLSPLQTGALRLLGASCARFLVRASGNWRVLRWDRVLAALLPARAQMGPLLPGRAVLGIEGVGALRLECDGQQFSFEVRPLSEASLVLDEALAMRVLFGPLPPSGGIALPGALSVLEQWCPLPLYWGLQDGV